MEIKVISGDVSQLSIDAVVVNIFEGMEYPTGAAAVVDEALDRAITQLIGEGEIKGKLNELTVLHSLGRIPARRVIVCGLGRQKELTLDKIRGVAAESCKLVRKMGVERMAMVAHGAGLGGLDAEKAGRAIAEGAVLGLYTFRKHITKEPEHPEIREILVVERDEERIPALERGCARGKVMAEAANFCRDLVNEPANFMTPSDMVKVAEQVAGDYGLELEVLEREEMRELGMGALLGVAQGSHEEPKFVVLRYRGDETSPETLGLVGKGITFDSGGISIKPSEKMDEMKGDMAGAAAVMAALKAIAELKLKINVTVLAPLTENLPGGAALKPGDVVRAMNAKTIEIVNTDAEGRMILADALSYAHKLGLSPLVDVATLTGACRVALGDVCTGVFGNNVELAQELVRAGEDTGERMWQMPMYEEYKEQNKSDVADVKNTGGRYGGAITAAQFLSEFVFEEPWAHLDIAGTSFCDKERTYLPKGASGVPVRTLVQFALTRAKNKRR